MTSNLTNTILTMLILGLLGFGLKKTKVADKRTDKFITVLLVNICTPALMISTTLTNFTIQIFLDSYKSIGVAVLSTLCVMAVSTLFAKMLSLKGMDRGQLLAMCSFSNVIFVGLPLITGIFGAGVVAYLMLYFIANTLTFWTLGIYLLSKDSGKGFSSKNLLKIINMPILGFVAGLLLLYYGISLPSYVMDSINALKVIMTPLSLIFVGSTIGDLSLERIGSPMTTVVILLMRFVISPLTVLLLLKLIPMPEELVKVFIVCAGLPAMTNISIAVGKYGGNPSYSSFITALTSGVFILVVPFYLKLFAFI
ncbi:AEC family transporter [Proteiniclasticum sp. BAD-10]|uniref:AEC family transporter n=1 Tax=Proteiniclasticum sediminis TaxID=2804028 RepID=A0A941CSN1_9CLOT|nr:AEC family transporter [Proteiniclasticum sediminis]MBR0576859.1 AEC family transporter [Proteiniclasticum sediminis]